MKKKITIRFFMLIFIIVCVYLLVNRTVYARKMVRNNMTYQEYVFAMNLRDMRKGRNILDNFEEYGLLYGKEDRVEVEPLVDAIHANCTEEEIEIYEKMLFGGFDIDKYVQAHSYEELYLLITKLNIIWPDKYTPVMEDGNYVYDEDGNVVMEEERFSFWRVLMFGEWGFERI